MHRLLIATTALALVATGATAGGIDRTRNDYALLFTPGNQIRLGLTFAAPEVSGDYSPTLTALGGAPGTGDMADNYNTLSFSYKQQFTENFAAALILGQPYGANSTYTGGFYDGLEANWQSNALTIALHYRFNESFSVFGGPRAIRSEATIAIPVNLSNPASDNDGPGVGLPGSIASEYLADGPGDTEWGFVLGAAYERPDIALRIGLTYESGITHSFSSRERFDKIVGFRPGPGGAPVPDIARIDDETTTEVELPQSILLDFQTEIAENTLLFGSVRWTEWSVFEIRPPSWDAEADQDITSFDNDVWTYQVGLGHRLSEEWAIFGRVTHESSNGGTASRLAPTDGFTSLGLGATYTVDNISITGGLEYAWIGDAEDGTETVFSGNTLNGLGVQIAYGF